MWSKIKMSHSITLQLVSLIYYKMMPFVVHVQYCISWILCSVQYTLQTHLAWKCLRNVSLNKFKKNRLTLKTKQHIATVVFYSIVHIAPNFTILNYIYRRRERNSTVYQALVSCFWKNYFSVSQHNFLWELDQVSIAVIKENIN